MMTEMMLSSGRIWSGLARGREPTSGDKISGDKKNNPIGIRVGNIIAVQYVFLILPSHVTTDPTKSPEFRRERMVSKLSDHCRCYDKGSRTHS